MGFTLFVTMDSQVEYKGKFKLMQEQIQMSMQYDTCHMVCGMCLAKVFQICQIIQKYEKV